MKQTQRSETSGGKMERNLCVKPRERSLSIRCRRCGPLVIDPSTLLLSRRAKSQRLKGEQTLPSSEIIDAVPETAGFTNLGDLAVTKLGSWGRLVSGLIHCGSLRHNG